MLVSLGSFSVLHSAETTSREWRNWQTRWLQVPVPARAWGFKSPLAHTTTSEPDRYGRALLFSGDRDACIGGRLEATEPGTDEVRVVASEEEC